MARRITTIELHKEYMKFSAGHFTIFSATEREPLHGHNFNVHASIVAEVHDIGMTFDYREYKNKIRELCRSLSQIFLLPEKSPYLRYQQEGDYLYVHFHQEKIPFLRHDVLLLPLTNITVEELSAWFVDRLLADQVSIAANKIQEITIKIFSGPGQSGSSTWKAA
jgi:6-pyruvoyltetrahydropterin/6-carboxytetrahydropterin synthase